MAQLILIGIGAGAATALLFASVAFGQGEPQAAGERVLRVCADPDNLPLSNARGEGYENKIAEQLAHDLRRRLEYTYFPQRMGFVRNTLRQKDPQTQQFKCDVIIGVPKGYELTATTRPYMRSTYALLFRHRPELESLKTADDLLKLTPAQLRTLRIGVFGRSPGADWLLLGPDVELRHTDYDLEAAAARIRATDYPLAEDFAANDVLKPSTEEEMLERFERAALEE